MVPGSDNRWFSVRIMPYRTHENKIDGLVITFTDASVSKALEAALRQEETELRELADSLPQLVFSSRADGSIDYLSRQWLDYTGVPEPEQLGDGWLRQVSPEDRERVRTAWSAAVKSGATFDSEFRLQSADGVPRWFKTRAAPIRNAQGLVQKWYGTTTDINDIRQQRRREGNCQREPRAYWKALSDCRFVAGRQPGDYVFQSRGGTTFRTKTRRGVWK